MMKQRLVLITGATAGIGQALVHLAAQKELKLLITGRNQEELKKLTDTFGSLIVQAVAADLSQEEGVKTIIDLIHKHCPDIIINNAGFGLYGEALSYSTVQQKHIVDVNVNAVLQLSLEGARALISQVKQGVILNVSSAISFQVAPNMAVYAATKAFINQFSQSLDEELKPLGIRVLVACPGMVKTEFSQNAGMTRTRKFTAVMSSKFVARAIWKQIESLTPLTIIDWKYRLLTWLSYLIPKKIVTAIIKNNIAKRIAPRNVIRLPSCKNK